MSKAYLRFNLPAELYEFEHACHASQYFELLVQIYNDFGEYLSDVNSSKEEFCEKMMDKLTNTINII